MILRRAATYAIALVAIAATYLATLSRSARVSCRCRSCRRWRSRVVNLAVLLLIAPIKARAQDAVDRVFYRSSYDAERALSELSHDAVGGADAARRRATDTRAR